MNEAAVRVLPFESGRAFLDCGLVVYRESYSYFRGLAREVDPEDQRAAELMLAVNHEWIHFIQSLTCGTLQGYAVHATQCAGAVLQALKTGQRRSEAEARFLEKTDVLTEEQAGFSMLDLLEGVAVTESFRMTFASPTAARFEEIMERMFPRKPIREWYQKTWRHLAGKIGPELALRFLAPVSFLALNFSENPGQAFSDLVSKLTTEKAGEYKGCPPGSCSAS